MKFNEMYEKNGLDDCRLYNFSEGDKFIRKCMDGSKFVYKVLRKNRVEDGLPYYDVKMGIYNREGDLLENKTIELSEEYFEGWCDSYEF